MNGREKLEGYLISLGYSFEKLGDDTWLINEPAKGLLNVMILLDAPVVMIRVNVMNTPELKKEEFLTDVLRLNATDVIHGAYALDGDKLILIDTLLIETLDKEELQSTLDAFSLALFQHFSKLSVYRN